MYIKICGITKPDQGVAIARLGVNALGFICVPASPRYIDSESIRLITRLLPPSVDRIGVFLGASLDEICQVVRQGGLNSVQLHGKESPEFCDRVKSQLSGIQVIKALNLQGKEGLAQVDAYSAVADRVLLDAYDPKLAGGTGKTLDWTMLKEFRPQCPWWLAGGLSPENIVHALTLAQPDGIDVSSGVERSPGDKDVARVRQLTIEVKNICASI